MEFMPLKGIRVLDFSHVIAGPFASHYLAQMGADVLKVENVNGGDVMRRNAKGPRSYLAFNAGKKHLALDITSEEGRKRVLDEVARADILLDNLKPGTLEKNGFGPDDLSKINPRLIYCAISGFGREGTWSKRLAYDHVVQAATGMMLMAGGEGDPPIKTGFPVIDTATGIIGALAIVSALHERERTGKGIFLDVSMTGAAMQLMYPFACEAMTTGESPSRVGNQGYSGSPAADLFSTADGRIALGVNTPKQFLALLDVLGMLDAAENPDFFDTPIDASAPASFLRSRDPAALKAALAERIAAWNGEQLERELMDVQVPAAQVQRIGEFAEQALRQGGLARVRLEEGEDYVHSPGLGFRARQL